FGFHTWVVGIFILVLYPVLSLLKLRDGIVTSSVVLFHVLNAGSLEPQLLWNEVALLVVGLGTATVINLLYMPKEDKQLSGLRDRLELLFSQIFTEIGNHLRDNTYVWSGHQLLEAEDVLEEGRK